MAFPYLQRARWVTDKFILAMLGLFPLVVGTRGYGNITAAKFWAFAVTTCVWAAAVLALLALGLLTGERYRLDVRPAHLCVGAFLAVGAVSAMTSEYALACFTGSNRYDGYLTTLMYAAIFFGASMLAWPRRRYAWALGFSVTVCCAIGAVQLLGYDPFGLYPDGTNYYDKFTAYNGAFLGTLGNTGVLAAYLCLAAPLLLIFSLKSRKKWDKLLLLPGAMGAAMLLLCDVDAGLAAAAGCILVSVPVAQSDPKRARWAAAGSGGLTAAGLGALYLWPGKSGTLYEMSQVLHGHLADEFGSHRGQIWKQAWELFREKPWLGGGPGTTALRFHIEWYSAVRDRTSVVTNAHNVYLGYLVNIGVFGALAYVAAIGCSLWTWLRRRGEALYLAVGAGFLCYLIQDFFGLGLSLSEPLLWLAWGLLEGAPPADDLPAESPAGPEEI